MEKKKLKTHSAWTQMVYDVLQSEKNTPSKRAIRNLEPLVEKFRIVPIESYDHEDITMAYCMVPDKHVLKRCREGKIYHHRDDLGLIHIMLGVAHKDVKHYLVGKSTNLNPEYGIFMKYYKNHLAINPYQLVHQSNREELEELEKLPVILRGINKANK